MRLAHKVSPLVGKNPVAQAVARQRFKSQVLTLQIRAYLMGEGEACREYLADASLVLAVGLVLCQDPRIIGTINACRQMSDADRWSRINAPCVDLGLQIAIGHINESKPAVVDQAIKQVFLIV